MADSKAAILLVDDRPERLLALEAALEELHQPIVRANSGREALRHLLKQDFAVILLDVNMPGMDGFETAKLIRQRASSSHTPIIFITAFGDEIHAIRGYSLGAVDYILAPVLPEVLRTKVAVFVELFAKTEKIKRQAESLQRRAWQMQKLAAASLAINSAPSTGDMLKTITYTARDIIGAHQAITLYIAGDAGGPKNKGGKSVTVGSFSEHYVDWCNRELKLDGIAEQLVAQCRSAMRLTDVELREHPYWNAIEHPDIPPIRGGILAVPLTGRGSANLGIIYLSERHTGEFTDDDEAILVQLAQMGSIAIENTIYAQERQANRIKDEFLATLSHELRTPLNAIIGWVQLLKIEGLEGEVAHGIDVIDRNARAQTKLIEDLLDASRITSGKLRLNLKPAALSPLVQAAVDTARPAANAKQITFDVRLTEDSTPISIDPDRIQQVVSNLLSNAVKFSPVGGRVLVQLDRTGSPEDEWLSLRVTDTGIGIDSKFLPFIFDRFRQADSTSTRTQGGLGIGLTIVRHIIEQHGGRVSAKSEGPGRGTTLVVELRAARRLSAVATQTETISSELWPEEPLASLAGLRVLLVDDEADARDVVAAILRRASANVLTAASAAEALDALEVFCPDILLSDIAMPNEDGYALIRQVNQRLLGKRTKLHAIALTAYAREEDRAQALTAGFADHLAKPIEPQELLTRISQLAAS